MAWRKVFASAARVLAGLTVIWLGLIASASAADRDCTASERQAANRQLWLNIRDKNIAVRSAALWALPAVDRSDHQRRLVQRDYVITYDDDLLVPLWTVHRLDPDRLIAMDRVNCFRQDERLSAPIASRLFDYDEPEFDQGHLVPSADMELSILANVNSFILSNMAPQYEGFNRGTWEALEEQVRTWARSDGDLYVISGSVFDRDENGSRDPDADAERMVANNQTRRVSVPSAFFKIVACHTRDGVTETLAILLPHDQRRRGGAEAYEYFGEHVVALDAIEAVTGVSFAVDRTNIMEASEIWTPEGNGSRASGSELCVR